MQRFCPFLFPRLFLFVWRCTYARQPVKKKKKKKWKKEIFRQLSFDTSSLASSSYSGTEFVQRDATCDERANSLEFFGYDRSTVSNTVEELIARCIMPPVDRETSSRERYRFPHPLKISYSNSLELVLQSGQPEIGRLVSITRLRTRTRVIAVSNLSARLNL